MDQVGYLYLYITYILTDTHAALNYVTATVLDPLKY